MKYLILLFVFSGCGAMKNLDKMQNNMESMVGNVKNMSGRMDEMTNNLKETNQGMKKTSAAIHMQTLSIALNDMLSERNVKYVTPESTTPTSMIPSAKALAEAATDEELVGIFYLFLTEINNAQPGAITPDTQKTSDLDKWRKLIALQLIAGFIPDKKIDVLIKNQLDGQYNDQVYNILLFRHLFITTFVFDMAIPDKNMNQAKCAVLKDYIEKLKIIENQGFKDKMVLTITGFYDTMLNLTIKLDKDYNEYDKKVKELCK